MGVIPANFLRLLRAVLWEKRPDINIDDVPGYLHRQREKALFATIFFFIFLQTYLTFFRPNLPIFMFVPNMIMFVCLMTGFLLILSGRFRLGFKVTIYSVMAVLFVFQILVIAKAQDYRAPFISSYNIAFFTLYVILAAGFFLDRRHVIFVGVTGLVTVALSMALIGTRAFFDTMIGPSSFIAAGTILLIYFVNLFETIQARLIELTGNLKTEVEQRTRDLRESEARFRVLFEGARDGILVADPGTGRIRFANARAAEMLGRGMEDVLTLGIDDIHPREELSRIKETFRKQAAGELDLNPNTPVLRADGSIIFADIASSRVEFDGKTYLLGAFRDVTERRNSEIELKNLARFPAENPNPILRVMIDGRIIYANDPARRILEHDPESSADRVRPSWRDHVATVIGNGRLHEVEEELNDGIYLLTFAPFADENYVNIYAMDITEKRRMENELRESKKKAEEANRAKSVFLANVSHDLRTPLNSVMGFSEILLRATTDARPRHLLEMIRSSGKDLLHLINDLLDITRIEAGMLALRPQPARLREIISGVERDISFEASRKGLGFRLELAPDVPEYVRCDAARLRQILDNLLGNAVKYTSRGSVGLKVNLRIESGEPFLVIAVRDTGPGIAPEDREKIFEMFYRIRPEAASGAGIGLALARNLVVLMGGRIEVESGEGEGSTFTAILPAHPVEAAAVVESSEPVSAPKIEGRALIVDDVEENRRVIAEALGDTGLELIEAETGEAAVRIAIELAPEVIFLDIRLPDIDGYEVLRRLRASDRTMNIPVVAVTASSTLEEATRADAAGFKAFLTKPLDISTLYREVSRLLGGTATFEPAYTPAQLASEFGALGEAARGEIADLHREAIETGGLMQAEHLGRRMFEVGEAGRIPGLSNLGRRLAEAADECRVADVRRKIEMVRRMML